MPTQAAALLNAVGPGVPDATVAGLDSDASVTMVSAFQGRLSTKW
jgi:hypothetical protein